MCSLHVLALLLAGMTQGLSFHKIQTWNEYNIKYDKERSVIK